MFKYETRAAEFERVALVYMDILYNTALRMTGNKQEAEDLVQETFLRAFKSFGRFRRNTNAKAWLFKIMTNIYINRYRKQTRFPQTELKEEVVAPGQMSDPDAEFFSQLLEPEVEEALESLPAEFRLAIVLVDLQGFSYQEAAEIIGCPVGTVRSRIARGRSRLSSQLYQFTRDMGYLKKESEDERM